METSLLLDVIVGRFPQERVLRKGKHAVFSALPYHTSKTRCGVTILQKHAVFSYLVVGMVEHSTTTCDVFASCHITQSQVPLAQRRLADAGAKKTQKTFANTSTKALSTSTTVQQATLNLSELTPGAGALPHGANSASVTTTETSPLIFV
jgi:hypothetical protein